MKKSKTKENLFIAGKGLAKLTGILSGLAVVAFLAGFGVHVALDVVERKERRVNIQPNK